MPCTNLSPAQIAFGMCIPATWAAAAGLTSAESSGRLVGNAAALAVAYALVGRGKPLTKNPHQLRGPRDDGGHRSHGLTRKLDCRRIGADRLALLLLTQRPFRLPATFLLVLLIVGGVPP